MKETSLIKSIFKKIDFESPYKNSKEILKLCNEKKNELSELKIKLLKTENTEGKQYIVQLIKLAESL